MTKEKDNKNDDGVNVTNYVTQEQLESFGSSLINNMKDIFKEEMEVQSELLGKEKVIPNTELGKDTRGIDVVSARDFVAQAELEDFMNDILTIYVHPSNNKEDNPVIVPNVNGVNQPIVRGQDCRVKRKFVEALARGRDTRYEQKFPDKSEPDKYIMAPDTVVTNSFVVRKDPHPKGHEWLQAILAEA